MHKHKYLRVKENSNDCKFYLHITKDEISNNNNFFI